MNSYLNHPDVESIIRLSLTEDCVNDDITTRACKFDASNPKKIRATIVAKKMTIACGSPLVEKILHLSGLHDKVTLSKLATEGVALKDNTPWLILEGSASDLLRIERTVLNFLIRTCGIAHLTSSIVAKIKHTDCKVLHTRKTAPGHRRTDVYAAITGGAHPHRLNLSDAILVKENHIDACGDFQKIVDGINEIREKASFVEIEVRDFTELKYALMAKPDRILLDNFTVDQAAKASMLFGSSVKLEASGGITAVNASLYAEAGVDFISLGALTHSAPAADLSMLFDYK